MKILHHPDRILMIDNNHNSHQRLCPAVFMLLLSKIAIIVVTNYAKMASVVSLCRLALNKHPVCKNVTAIDDCLFSYILCKLRLNGKLWGHL